MISCITYDLLFLTGHSKFFAQTGLSGWWFYPFAFMPVTG